MTIAQSCFDSRVYNPDTPINAYYPSRSYNESDIREHTERPPSKRRRTTENLGNVTMSDNGWDCFEVQSWPVSPIHDPRTQPLNTNRDELENGFPQLSPLQVSTALSPYSPASMESSVEPMRYPMSATTAEFPRQQYPRTQSDSKVTRARRCSCPALVKPLSSLGDVPKVGRASDRGKPEPGTCEFIDDTRPFPKEQQWVRPEPAPKVFIDMAALNSISTSPAPAPGESLSLEKHADRIAALIDQKRKANEMSSFRQKLVRKQMAHRGVPDPHEMILSLSHDNLKRRMEASASGLLDDTEEFPEYSFELILADAEGFSSPTRAGHAPVDQEYNNQHRQLDSENETLPESTEFGELSVSDPSSELDAMQDLSAGHHLTTSISHQPNLGYEEPHQTAKKHPREISSDEMGPSETTVEFPTQQLYHMDCTKAHTSNTEQTHHDLFSEPWSRQLRQALPKTKYPEISIETNENRPATTMNQSTTNTKTAGSRERTGWQHMNIFSRRRATSSGTAPSSSTTKSIFTRLPSSFKSLRNVSSTFHLSRPPVLSSNMNMFTGHARENFLGVARDAAPVGTTRPMRRNMFRS